jgi:hypothetical protein
MAGAKQEIIEFESQKEGRETKSEGRNPKSERNPKLEIRINLLLRISHPHFQHGGKIIFGFLSDFGDSEFGF